MKTEQEKQAEEAILLATIKERLQELESLLQKSNDKWVYEDGIYRFYYQSFKVYRLQETTEEIVSKLRGLMPHLPMTEWFVKIVQEGTGKQFSLEHNSDWLTHTRPIVEAFFHARYMLEMICKYGTKKPSNVLPTGWAAVLCLYDIR